MSNGAGSPCSLQKLRFIGISTLVVATLQDLSRLGIFLCERAVALWGDDSLDLFMGGGRLMENGFSLRRNSHV